MLASSPTTAAAAAAFAASTADAAAAASNAAFAQLNSQVTSGGINWTAEPKKVLFELYTVEPRSKVLQGTNHIYAS